MKAFSFYDPATGLLTGETFYASNVEHVVLNTPAGLAAIEGEWNSAAYQVDRFSLQIVPRTVPPPDPDPDRKRRETLRRIAELEARQMRPLREIALDPHDRAARERVQAIDEQIAQLRDELRNLPA